MAFADFLDRQPGSRALRWAMARVREDLRERPSISPKRRAVILGALGPAVHRAIQKGRVRTRAELGELVGFIRARLEERRGLGEDLGATRRWAEWCVREGLRRVEEGRAAREAAAQFLVEEARARAEARRAWATWSGCPGWGIGGEAPDRRPWTLIELVPDVEERRQRYLALLASTIASDVRLPLVRKSSGQPAALVPGVRHLGVVPPL